MSTVGPVVPAARRDGAQTRREVQRVALELFTAQGYAETSLRQVAEALGINKASLYYHFRSKDDILRSLFEDRGAEAEALLGWVRRQPPGPDLVREVVLRWVDASAVDKLRGIRLLAANPRLAGAGDGARIGRALAELVEVLGTLLPDPTPSRVLVLRMALTSINAAVGASAGTGLTDDDVVAAARRTATVLVDDLLAG